jgi:hypothetical protein
MMEDTGMARKRKDDEVETPDSVATVVELGEDNSGHEKTDRPVESKSDRFRRLAVKRMGNFIKRIRSVANLANRANYDYTQMEALKITATIRDECNEAIKAFERGDRKDSVWTL